MKASLLALLLPAAASARFIEADEVSRLDLHPEGISTEPAEQFLVELSPGVTKLVTEEQKWELRRNGQRFMDITEHKDLGTRILASESKSKPVFPSKVSQQSDVNPMLKNLTKTLMREHLEKFTSFHTRYYKSDYGRQSSEWLLKTVQDTIKDAGADKHGVSAKHFTHSWGQNSIIATIPGQSNSTVVIGAHQDSINLWFPSMLAAPGADDDGSGTVTILEAFRVLLQSEDVVKGKAPNTIEFHWYSAEEGGLLGSQAIFSDYAQNKRDIKAMLQQDMTGFVQKTTDAGKPESVGVIMDFVDPGLTAFIKKVIEEYCQIPWVETKCGYACSDHASASKAGYPSAFVIESEFKNSDDHIHGTEDLIKYLSFDHMLQHARMTLGLAYELGFTDFAKLEKSEQSIDEL
ncbi:Leucine aminopeptidase 1 [Apiospora kogelbergensis]|uniref:Peptide hydrolase n=1 Tax=Apiospora kogelbergensis TaxID=1337665 RepID=A0AAW0QTH1_9PEZI